MEIGHQPCHGVKTVTRSDKQPGVGIASDQYAALRGRFQCPQTGGADRNHITTGRISPWVLFHCTSGLEFLEKLDEEQVAMIMPYIDPVFYRPIHRSVR